jgi:ribosomal protein S18 acetylase RimI-like enzyme
MKIIIRKSSIDDLNQVFNLHNKCFSFNDRWYLNAIRQYIDNSIVIEYDKNIIGVLLQGEFIPVLDNEKYISIIENNKNYNNSVYGIVMLCVDTAYRNLGLATKLIDMHKQLNKKKTLYLCTRRSNEYAISLYIKNNYINVGYIENKYYLPSEDAFLMMYNNL